MGLIYCQSEILRSANLIQHVQSRTHRQGHILDLINTREGDDLVRGESVSSMLADHFLVNTEVSLKRHFSPVTSV